MNVSQLPKVRISLYKYGLDTYSFAVAFKAKALEQGWTPNQIEKVVFPIKYMDSTEAFEHLIQFAIITKMPKGIRVKKGQIIEPK